MPAQRCSGAVQLMCSPTRPRDGRPLRHLHHLRSASRPSREPSWCGRCRCRCINPAYRPRGVKSQKSRPAACLGPPYQVGTNRTNGRDLVSQATHPHQQAHACCPPGLPAVSDVPGEGVPAPRGMGTVVDMSNLLCVQAFRKEQPATNTRSSFGGSHSPVGAQRLHG